MSFDQREESKNQQPLSQTLWDSMGEPVPWNLPGSKIQLCRVTLGKVVALCASLSLSVKWG